MDEVFGRAFTVALLVAMALLIAYQFGMLYWTKKTAGSVPKVIKILRGVNITLLVLGTALIVYKLVSG